MAADVSTVDNMNYTGYLKDKNGVKLYPHDKKQFIIATANELSTSQEYITPSLLPSLNSDSTNSFIISNGRIKVLRDMTAEISMQACLENVAPTNAAYIMLFVYIYDQSGALVADYHSLTSGANYYDTIYMTPIPYKLKANYTVCFGLNNPNKSTYKIRGGVGETHILVKEI